MADIQFTCASCGETLEAPEDMAGQTVECPACRQAVAIPAAAENAQTESAACPSCQAAMEPEAVLCVACGFHKGLGMKIATSFG